MTTAQKFQYVVNQMTTTIKPAFYVGSIERLNADLQQVTTFPAVLFIQPISGKYSILNTVITKQPNVLIWFALQNKSKLHRTGSEVNTDEETAHGYVVEFIKQYNKSGKFKQLTEVDWSFTVDQTDKNLTFVALQFNCKEIDGFSIC